MKKVIMEGPKVRHRISIEEVTTKDTVQVVETYLIEDGEFKCQDLVFEDGGFIC